MTEHRQQTRFRTQAMALAALWGIVPANTMAQELQDLGSARHHHPELARQHGHHTTTTKLPVGITLSTAWDSHYVSEGRDNLDGDSLFGATLELSFKGFNFGAWYANSPDNSYDEFNAWLEYALEIDDFEIYAGYTYLKAMDDDLDDDKDEGRHPGDESLDSFFYGGVALTVSF